MSIRPIAILLHVSAAGIMAYGYQGLGGLAIDAWIKSQMGGHMQFLTIQGLAIAWLAMVISFCVDLFPTSWILRRVKRALFMIAMPLAAVISSIYWTLLLFSPNLILQPEAPSETSPSSSEAHALFHMPLDVDLALHATPALTLLADFMLLESRKYTREEIYYGAPVVVSAAGLWYGCWVEYCARFNGTFPYPFLTENPFKIRLAIYAGASALALVSFWTINALHPVFKRIVRNRSEKDL